MDHMLSVGSLPWFSVDEFTGSNQPMGPKQQSHPREANAELCELSTEASMAGNVIDFVPGMSASMTLGYTLARLGLPLDIQGIMQGFSFGIADAFSYNNMGNLDYFSNPVPNGNGVVSSQTGVQSLSGQLWGISGSPHCAEEHPTGYKNGEGFFGFLASRLTEEPAGNLQNGDTCETDLSSILQEQCEGITAGSLSPVNPGSQDDNLPEMLTETQSEGIRYGQPDAFSDSVETFSGNVYSPSCRAGSLTPPQDTISFTQGPESNQEAVTSSASCINPVGCHTQSPEPVVPGTTERPSSPMRSSIDIIDLTLDSDETPAATATPNTNSATSRTAHAVAEGLPLMPNGMNRRTESSRSKRRNHQKRKRCHEDVQSFPEIVTLRVISVKVEKENRDGFMETVEFIRHKSRKWKAKESNEECIIKLREVVSFEMMVQGGSLGRINIHKSEDADTYKGTEPLMEYMVVLSKDEADKVLDDPEKSLGTRCHLLQEQNRSKTLRVA
ncbi:hypothetical protein FOQG_16571 [Fusarium oxysporum f. sp. raphani 54005]|uniref:Uncharacterized protein n=2 Tax=Fusarium oxysporum f. sp. raphani TaxID=96318 RepID=X0BAI8_FUSOX|nr:hypothetical protein FOQG_16571 [Fusarium oxysporum f. sp. raphani 54005]KAG7432017.1 hypothetical protein Forpi1262_v007037 [Fusarium oxysporum f. sp. raphani]